MSEEKCFCHLGGYAVKDATARKKIEELEKVTDPEYIKKIDTWHSLARENTVSVIEGYGIQWDGEYSTWKDLTQDERVAEGKTNNTIPLLPGNGIEFEVNEKGNAVKINASGGGGTTLNKYEVTTNNPSLLRMIHENAKGRVHIFDTTRNHAYYLNIRDSTLHMVGLHFDGSCFYLTGVTVSGSNTSMVSATEKQICIKTVDNTLETSNQIPSKFKVIYFNDVEIV